MSGAQRPVFAPAARFLGLSGAPEAVFAPVVRFLGLSGALEAVFAPDESNRRKTEVSKGPVLCVGLVERREKIS